MDLAQSSHFFECSPEGIGIHVTLLLVQIFAVHKDTLGAGLLGDTVLTCPKQGEGLTEFGKLYLVSSGHCGVFCLYHVVNEVF